MPGSGLEVGPHVDVVEGELVEALALALQPVGQFSEAKVRAGGQAGAGDA